MARVQHAGEDVQLPLSRLFHVDDRRVVRRRGGKAGYQRYLSERKFVQGFFEIIARRGRDAVRAVAEIKLIEIKSEYLIFVQISFKARGEYRFPDLPLQRSFAGEKERTGYLLRYRAASLFYHAGPQVRHERPGDRAHVHALVFEEARVFRIYERLQDALGYLFERREDAALKPELADLRSIACKDLADDGRVIIFKRFYVRQIARVEKVDAEERGGGNDDHGGDYAEQKFHEPQRTFEDEEDAGDEWVHFFTFLSFSPALKVFSLRDRNRKRIFSRLWQLFLKWK